MTRSAAFCCCDPLLSYGQILVCLIRLLVDNQRTGRSNDWSAPTFRVENKCLYCIYKCIYAHFLIGFVLQACTRMLHRLEYLIVKLFGISVQGIFYTCVISLYLTPICAYPQNGLYPGTTCTWCSKEWLNSPKCWSLQNLPWPLGCDSSILTISIRLRI